MGEHIHISKRDALADSQGRKLSPAAKRLSAVYRRNVLAFYRVVRDWMTMTRKALQYGVEQQFILGKEPRYDLVPDWSAWRPPTSELARLYNDHRVAKVAKALANGESPGGPAKIGSFTDVQAHLVEARANGLVDWECVRYHGEKQLFQNHLRIYGQAMGQAAQIGRISTTWDVVNRQAVDWALARSSELVTSVTNETKATLRSVIGDGIAQGKSMDTIGKEILPLVGLNDRQLGAMEKFRAATEELYGAGSRKADKLIEREFNTKHAYRAEMIARTETARSVSEGTIAGYKEADVREMRWEASLDSCEICAEQDGVVYGVLEGEGILPFHPQCRCTWTPLTWATEAANAPEVETEAPAPEEQPTDLGLGLPGLGILEEEMASAAAKAAGEVLPAVDEYMPAETIAEEFTPPLVGLGPDAVGERLVGGTNVLGDMAGFRDSVTGDKWFAMAADTRGQVANQIVTNELYSQLGINVPKAVAMDQAGEHRMVMQMASPKPLNSLSGRAQAKALKEGRNGFVADVWLNNRPFGLGEGPLVDDGKLVRLPYVPNNLYGGQSVKEWRDLLDPAAYPKSAKLYAGITDKEVVRQINGLAKVMTDDRIAEIVSRAGASRSASWVEAKVDDLKARRDQLVAQGKEMKRALADARKMAKNPPPTVAASDPKFVSGKIKSSENLGGGCNGSFKVAIDGDGDGCYKPASGEYGMPGTGYAGQELRKGLTPGTMYKREVAASIMDKHLGFGIVPETVVKDGAQGVGSVQKWAEGAKPTSAYNDAATALPVLERAKLNAFDMLIGNTDRHGGNLLLDGVPTYGQAEGAAVGRVVAIDNGCAFTSNKDIKSGVFGVHLFLRDYDFPRDYKLPDELHSKLADLQKNWKTVEKDLSPLIDKPGLTDTKKRLDTLVAHPEKFREYAGRSGRELLRDAMGGR